MKHFVFIYLMLMSLASLAQDQANIYEKWQHVMTTPNHSTAISKIHETLQYRHWYQGLLLYADGTIKETSICFSSFYNLSKSNGFLKTTTVGEVPKKNLSGFVIDQYFWTKHSNNWGMVQIQGPISYYVTYDTSEEANSYLLDEQRKELSAADLSSGFRKKMKNLVGDHLSLIKKIDQKEVGYKYSSQNLVNILNEYNEWVRINDPNRYSQAMQLVANK